jgi:hypothetical protein
VSLLDSTGASAILDSTPSAMPDRTILVLPRCRNPIAYQEPYRRVTHSQLLMP